MVLPDREATGILECLKIAAETMKAAHPKRITFLLNHDSRDTVNAMWVNRAHDMVRGVKGEMF